jgi:uroporphyrinogen decarboxylase
MIRFWEEFVCRLLGKVFSVLVPDAVHFSEDMAYKDFSMISPAMVRDFLLPTYGRWGKIIREAGCPIYAMDSDGFIGELIPIWMEAGINVCDPVEAAANNDIAGLRKRHGKRMAFRGGVDKRAIARGGAAIQEEIRRLRPVMQGGGYIPSCDHGIPPDVSWADFVSYTKLLAEATEWM